MRPVKPVKSKVNNKKVVNLFGEEINPSYTSRDNPWDHWKEMPKYDPKPEYCHHDLTIEFENDDEIMKFADMIGDESITLETKSIWYPKRSVDDYSNIRFISLVNEDTVPKYPIYIVSKGRFEKRPTSDTLCNLGVPHYIVVEESQYEDYHSRVDPKFVTVLILDPKFQDDYVTHDGLGNTKSKGPGPARNFAWDHSKKLGFKRHWVMDDNIQNFYRVDGSKRVIVSTGAVFRAMEDHTDQYDNILMSGPNYRFFNPPMSQNPPFFLNTRVYSCNLILNDCPFRWSGRFNEDTILSLDILEAGYCTIQYNAFLQGKMVTQAMGGGNTEEFYNKEGTLPKSQMLVDVYPNIAKLVWKFNRWHHYVDYSIYDKNRLKYRDGIELRSVNNEYTMNLVKYTQIKFEE